MQALSRRDICGCAKGIFKQMNDASILKKSKRQLGIAIDKHIDIRVRFCLIAG